MFTYFFSRARLLRIAELVTDLVSFLFISPNKVASKLKDGNKCDIIHNYMHDAHVLFDQTEHQCAKINFLKT